MADASQLMSQSSWLAKAKKTSHMVASINWSHASWKLQSSVKRVQTDKSVCVVFSIKMVLRVLEVVNFSIHESRGKKLGKKSREIY